MIYSGSSAYCYSNSLHMCLSQAGMDVVPDVSFLECLTGMPFGASFLNFGAPMFFPNAASTDPHEGLTQAIATMGWACELWQGDDQAHAKDALEESLQHGPVLLGPIDMSFLRYDPNHEGKTGGDHFLVVLAIEGSMVRVHDPQFYPYAVLSLRELLQAWDAHHIGYINKRYTLRHGFQEINHVSRDEMLRSTIELAQTFQRTVLNGPQVYAGSTAFEQALALLDPIPPKGFAGLLTYFALPVGARRSIDAMRFMGEGGQPVVAELYNQRAELFGSAQYYAATENWSEVTRIFKHLTNIEKDLANTL